jgi:hypothetical protein
MPFVENMAGIKKETRMRRGVLVVVVSVLIDLDFGLIWTLQQQKK